MRVAIIMATYTNAVIASVVVRRWLLLLFGGYFKMYFIHFGKDVENLLALDFIRIDRYLSPI